VRLTIARKYACIHLPFFTLFSLPEDSHATLSGLVIAEHKNFSVGREITVDYIASIAYIVLQNDGGES
jgi:hypothetical protein